MADVVFLKMFVDGNSPNQLSYNNKKIKFFIVSTDVFHKLVKAFGSSGDKNGLENIMSKMIAKNEVDVRVEPNAVVSFKKGEYEFMGIALATEKEFYTVQLQVF